MEWVREKGGGTAGEGGREWVREGRKECMREWRSERVRGEKGRGRKGEAEKKWKEFGVAFAALLTTVHVVMWM